MGMYLWIAAGGALGTAIRFFLSGLVAKMHLAAAVRYTRACSTHSEGLSRQIAVEIGQLGASNCRVVREGRPCTTLARVIRSRGCSAHADHDKLGSHTDAASALRPLSMLVGGA